MQGREDFMRHALAAAAVALAVSTQSAVADPSVNDLAARTEIRPIETLTLTDQQFLTGDKNGKATTIAGALRFPQGATGRLPAVVLLHGSGGVSGSHELWSKHFNEMGIASFLIDSFSARGLTSTSADQALLGRFNMILDAYRGADVIAAHPRIDPARIAVIGFSRGGQSALYSSLRRFQQAWAPRVTFAAHIPLYASCNPTLIGDTDVSAVPIRQFHGAADDYVPVAPCRAYFERLRAAGRDAKLTEYPDAHHSYDNPLGPKTPTVAKGSQSVRACKLKEEPLGMVINVETGQPFTYKDPCIQTDPHLGSNEAAAQATRVAVKELLRTTFKLD
jgi:dienelactone hydrolase